MGKDRYLVAYTTDTLLVGDLQNNKLSEVCVNIILFSSYFFDSSVLLPSLKQTSFLGLKSQSDSGDSC